MLKIILALSLFSAYRVQAKNQGPHKIPIDISFTDSQRWYQELSQNKSLVEAQDQFITDSIRAGERMSAWLAKINEGRSSNDQIRLTSSTSRGGGIPIEKASKYGPSTIKSDYESLKNDMPLVLQDVMLANGPITANLPVDVEVFVLWAKKVSYNYQTAVRWTGMQQWLPWYTQAKSRDIRGFYFLGQIKNLNQTLVDFDFLSAELQQEIKGHLVNLCYNTEKSDEECAKNFELYQKSGDLLQFKNRYWAMGASIWNSYFKISNPRSDIEWSANAPEVMKINFKDPSNIQIADWLKDNVEDEFKRANIGWALEMNFVSGGPGTAHIEFRPNVTPHVSGGNVVVMDENTPIEEFSSRWTIRHEFGHILRLPDCYHEFYVPSENVMMNYQLDVTDLMCSRSGDMNDRIYQELKRVYFR